MGIAHRDIKLENILLMGDNDLLRIKLSDFNHSKMMGPTEEATDYFGQLVNTRYYVYTYI
jgi:serine/threonine protein kinase